MAFKTYHLSIYSYDATTENAVTNALGTRYVEIFRQTTVVALPIYVYVYGCIGVSILR